MKVPSTSMKPSNGNVILYWNWVEDETTSFGLVITGQKKRGEFATVVAVGKNSVLEVGQKVIFNKLSGVFATEGVEEFLIIKETEVYGVLED